MVSAGIVAVEKEAKPYVYRVTNSDLAKTPDLNLPTPEDIAERVAIMSEECQEVVADVTYFCYKTYLANATARGICRAVFVTGEGLGTWSRASRKNRHHAISD